MIYDSLDIIPYKTFLKVAETGNLFLLSDTEKDPDVLMGAWEILHEQHLNRQSGTSQEKKIFRISKEISSLETQYKFVLLACDALKFDYNQNIIDRLTIKYHYTLRCTNTETYYQDIEQIERESKALKVKINTLSKLLPKVDQGEDYSVDDVMASYCSILGYQIGDFNLITYAAFHGYEKQVHAKIEAYKKQEIKNKKNG